MRILCVCLGNICRSPLAEGILKEKIKQYDLDWTVDSAGTGSWHIGERPDPRSIRVALQHGIDITDQRARQFKQSDFDRFDLILAMDGSNFRDILQKARSEEDRKKVHLILDFLFPGKHESVPDPYWDDDGFETVFQLLDKACDGVIKHFQTQKHSI